MHTALPKKTRVQLLKIIVEPIDSSRYTEHQQFFGLFRLFSLMRSLLERRSPAILGPSGSHPWLLGGSEDP